VAVPDGKTVIAVGDAGTILRSTDGGASWTLQSSGESLQPVSGLSPRATAGRGQGGPSTGAII